MKIPHPDNPCHTDNLASIELLEAQGWEGPDASLDISLFEYDCAWRELPEPDNDGDSLLVIYRIRGEHEDNSRFDRCGFKADLDVFKEWDWVDWDSMLDSHGVTREEWMEGPLTMKIHDLLNYYGHENIFGTSYWEGFKISTETTDEEEE